MSRDNIKKEELEKLCEDPILKYKVINAKDGKEARVRIKEVLSDNQDVTETTAESYMKRHKSELAPVNSINLVESVDPTNSIEPVDPTNPVEPVDSTNRVEPAEPINPVETAESINPIEPAEPINPIEPAEPINPIEPAEPINPIEPVDSIDRDIILKNIIEEEKKIEAAKKKKLDEEIENKRISKLLKEEKITGKTEEEIKAIYLCVSLLKDKDTLKVENKKLNDDNDSLKNQNELLKQKVKVLTDQKGIKDDFTSKIPSLNDIASSENKISVFINKEVLAKATKYVDAHCLVRLENVIINGYDLNSAIVQSVLLEFILQNSLL